MSLKHIRAVAIARGLTSKANHVLRVLADRASEARGTCFPSQATIAYDTGLSPRTVWAALKELEAAGWITRKRRESAYGWRTSDVYTVMTLQEAAQFVGRSLEASNSQHLRVGQLATFAKEPTRTVNQPDLRKEATGARPPHESGDRPPESQHEMAERLRKLA